jgi:hypothetical protein
MDGQTDAVVQTDEQQMEQTEPRVDAECPPKSPRAGQLVRFLQARTRNDTFMSLTSSLDVVGGVVARRLPPLMHDLDFSSLANVELSKEKEEP